MIKNYYVLSLFLTLTIHSSPSEVVGKYQAAQYNLLERGWMYLTNQVYSPYETLEIRQDATFIFTGCTTKTGNWIRQADTLVLTVEHHDWTIDSFNISGFKGQCPTIPKLPYKFIVKENYLINKSRISIQGKEKVLVRKFKKNQHLNPWLKSNGGAAISRTE